MKILLFVTSIKNTLINGEEKDYKNLINNIDKIMELNDNDLAFISFCDATENRNVMLFHARKMINYMNGKRIFFGEQFLGDVHYKDLDSGALVYKNLKLNKINEIINYVKKMQSNGNNVEIIVADGNMDIDEYKEEFKKNLNCPCSFIYNIFNVREINDTLTELYEIKEKGLNLKN